MDSENIEEIRLSDLSSLEEAFGEPLEDIKKRFNNEFGKHEAMDRAFLMSENIQLFLVEHPYVIFRPEAYKLAFQASELLAQLYQVLGRSDYNA